MPIWDDVVTDLDRVVYASYERPLPVLHRPALLFIDYYNAVFGDHPEPLPEAMERFPSSCGLAGWEALPHAERLLAAARGLDVPVFYTTGETRPEAGRGKVRATKRQSAEPFDGARGSPEWGMQIVESLRPLPGEAVIYKQRASGFFGTPLVSHLVQLGVDGLIVAGESTSGCVRASVVDAYSYGFPVLLVGEATFDRSQISHKINLFDLHHKYAWVVGVETAVAAMKGSSTEALDRLGVAGVR